MNPCTYSNGTELAFPELAIAGAVLLSLILGLFCFAIIFFPNDKKNSALKIRPLRLLIFSQLPTIFLLIPALLLIGCRHFGEWKELKRSIQYYENLIVKDPLSQDGQLIANFNKLNEKHFTPPPTQYFQEGDCKVSFRMMTTIRPYIGVDFGGGANAVFNPDLMIMTYAD